MVSLRFISLNVVVVCALIFPSITVSSNTDTVFGPKIYTRHTGSPVEVIDHFNHAHPGQVCLLQVSNEGRHHKDRKTQHDQDDDEDYGKRGHHKSHNSRRNHDDDDHHDHDRRDNHQKHDDDNESGHPSSEHPHEHSGTKDSHNKSKHDDHHANKDDHHDNHHNRHDDRNTKRIASALITLNTIPVFEPHDFNQHVAYLEKPVTLQAENTLNVTVKSKPKSTLAISIVCDGPTDTTPPGINATVTPDSNANGWHNSDVTVIFQCTDSDSGIATCSEPVIVSADGALQEITGQAVDNAGNVATTSVIIHLDKTAPTLFAEQSPITNAHGWNSSDVSINYTCTDITSGVDTCPSPHIVTTEGQQHITQSITDRAGNTTALTTSIQIDTSDPTISARRIPGPNTAGWNNTDVTVHFDCADAVSGVAECTAPIKVSSEGGGQLIAGTVSDYVGKTASATLSLNIDKTAPLINVVSPSDGVSIKNRRIDITGTVVDENAITSLKINGVTFPLQNNAFNQSVDLNLGFNALEIVATDIANNQRTKVLSVIRLMNHPPQITSTPIFTTVDSALHQYTVTAIDEDATDTLSYHLLSHPTGMSIDSQSGTISWIPTENQIGEHVISVQVSDPENATDTQTFTLTVSSSNQAPHITSNPITTAVSDTAYSYNVEASDPDGDVLEFSLANAPSGMTIDSSSGVIDWTPTELHAGNHDIVVQVHDDHGNSAEQHFTLTVTLPTCTVQDEIVTPIQLTTWLQEDVPGGTGGGEPRWELNASGFIATQRRNAWTTHFVSPTDLSSYHIRGTLRVDDTFDDDSMGVTFGYQDVRHYYVLYWRNGRSTNEIGPLHIFRINTTYPTPWSKLEVLYANYNLRWEPNVTYTYDVGFYDGGFNVTLKQGDTILENISVPDTTFTTGRFGFHNGSQPLVRYTANTVENSCIKDGDNHLPVFTSSPQIYAFEGTSYTYQLKAVDPDVDDTITYSYIAGPAGVSVDSQTGLLTWNTPTIHSSGYRIHLRATDSKGGYTNQYYLLYVRPPNNAPVITSTPVGAATAFNLYSYDVDASDADGDSLTYSLSPAPAGMTIDSATGVISWTPTLDQLGRQEAWVHVHDGQDVATQGFNIYVYPSNNNAPSITSTPPSAIAVENQLYTYDVNATDPDGHALTYALTTSPSGMSIDASTGLIHWTPTSTQLGSHSVAINVSDGFGGSATQSFALTVQQAAPNEPPVITSTPVFTAKSGYQYRYQVIANDPNNDSLNYSFINAPIGMQVNASGLITWTPAVSDIGSHLVTLRVNDAGFYVDQTWTLNVIDGTVPLSATVIIDPTSVNEGDTVTIIVNVQNAAGNITRSVSVDGNPVALDSNGMAQLTATGIGQHTVVASVTDVSGIMHVNANYFVKDPNDTTPPVVDITSPMTDTTVTVKVDITGSITEANLQNYVLAYAPAGSNDYVILAEGNTAFSEQPIATFDATMLVNGLYNIVLQATDMSGQTSSDSIQVLVDGNLKVGNFSFTVVDLEIPVSGIPIRVTRTYDSRRKHEDLDFGYGWTIGYQDAKVEESRTPGKGWSLNQYPSGPLGIIPLWCVEPQGNLRVSVTLPDGEVENFKVQATPACVQSTPVLDVKLNFVPDAGTLGTLKAVDDAVLRLNQTSGNLEFLGDVNAFDPNSYIYTSQQGFQYHLDQRFGIEKVIDLNGNTLTYTDNGIVHSDGKSVLFNRDAQGRITSITDPSQNSMAYDYDGQGNLAAYTDLETHTTTYTYNNNHGLVDILDPLGRGVIKNIYNDDGRLIAQEDAHGIRTEFDHNIDGRESVVTNRRGYITRYFYDDRGNVTVKVDADGATVYEYDSDDNLLSTMNPLGEMSTATYDDRRNQLTQTNDLGHTVRFAYNQRGQETKIYDARGNLPFENTYDSLGNLRIVKDPEGNIATQTPNAKGLIELRVDALMGETHMTYDANGNKLTETDSEGNVTAFTYDDNGNVKTETRQRTVDRVLGITVNDTTTYDYDKLNRLVSTTDALGIVSEVEYDEAGNEWARISAVGTLNEQRTDFEYDAYRRLTKTTYQDLTTETNSYDAEGNLIASLDRQGRLTQYRYDALNRQTKVIYPDGTFTQTEYDQAGRVITEIDEKGNRTQHAYDRAGRRILTRNADLKETHFTYDEDGNLKTQTDAKNHTTRFEYDALDRRRKTIFHDNSEMREDYDALGRLTLKTDQSNIQTKFDYDSLGRLTHVYSAYQTPLENVTVYTYDEAGNKLTQTDANSHTTEWTYDALGRVETRTLPEGQQESFTYDENGNQKTHTDFNQHTTTFDYDNNNRLSTVTYFDGSSESYTYTANGQRESATNSQGTTTYTYDERNRIKTETQPVGTRLTYDYDAAGNRTLLQTEIHNQSTNSTDTTVTTYTYDNLNRLHTVTDHHNQTTTYTYDAVGNRQSVVYPNGNVTTYTYDSLNRLTDINTRDSTNTVIDSFHYALYPTGHRQTITENIGRTSEYLYDELYRLTQETINDPTLGTIINSYDYDNVGNRSYSIENGVHTAYAYDNNDRLLTAGGETYTYDDNGSLLTTTIDNRVTTHTYDARNKLVDVSITENGSQISNVTYQYDVDGFRTRKNDNNTITNFVVDKNMDYAQVIHETNQQNVTHVTYTHGDDLISQDRSSTINYYNYDGLGSTRSLTDSTGQMTDTYLYSAYGELLDQAGNTENDYLYTGEQFDASLDKYYLRARYYDPSNGRFTQMDSWMGINSDPVTLHKYAYGNMDPVNHVDPSGNFSIGEIMASTTVKATLTTLTVVSTGLSIFELATGQTELTPTKIGAALLFSRLPIKYFKTLANKFEKKTGVQLKRVCLRNSFREGTLVKSESGLLPIEDIKIGDSVWAFDEKNNVNILEKVTHLISRNLLHKLVTIHTEEGEILVTTQGHEFNVNGDWKLAIDIKTGDKIKTFDDETQVLKIVKHDNYEKVYNFSVNRLHNYYVNSNNLLSHNEDDCIISVGNMGEFFNSTAFGATIRNVLSKTSRQYQGQSIYKASKASGQIKKGDYVYLDNLHKNHLEVFDKNGKFLKVLNLDGSVNAAKTAAAAGRSIKNLIK